MTYPRLHPPALAGAPLDGQQPPRAEAGALLAGSALLVVGLRRRGLAGSLTALLGAGLVARALAPLVRRAVIARGSARRRVDVRSTVIVDRPVRDVFAFFTDFGNFPMLVESLESVVDHGDGRSHWVLRRTDGRVVEWDATVTKFLPNQVIAWASVPESAISSNGIVRLESLGPSSTRVTLRVGYRPPPLDVQQALRAFLRPSVSEEVKAQLALAPERLVAWDPLYEPAPPTPMTPPTHAD